MLEKELSSEKRAEFRTKTGNSQPSILESQLALPQLAFKKVSTSACCKPDFVRLPPKRLAVRSFIYPTEVKFPPKRDATYPES